MYFADASTEDIADYVANYESGKKFANPESTFFKIDRYDVDKKNKVLIIKNEDDGLFKKTSYKYSLSGWVSQYGMPLQLSLAFHLSTMAPDFAYEIAQHAAEFTRVELGLVEMNDVNVRLAIKLDLGDGPKEYIVEEEMAVHILNTGDGVNDTEENNYNSQTEANADSEEEDPNQQNNNNNNGTFDTDLEELEKEIQNEFNANGRILAGKLVYKAENMGGSYGYNYDTFKDTKTTMYDSTNNKKVGECSYIVNSSYVYALKNLVEKYDKKKDGVAIAKVIKILENYFKLESIDNLVRYDGGTTTTISPDSTDRTIKQWMDDLKNKGSDYDFHYNGDPYNYYAFHPGGNASETAEWYLETGTNPSGTTGIETGFFYSDSLYFVPPIEDFVHLIIEEDTTNISNLQSFGSYVADHVFSPVRVYYRLLENVDTNGDQKVDEDDGTVCTKLTEGKGIDDYFYTSSSRKYYKNDEGWFWGKSIPIELYNAIEKAKFDYEEGLKQNENPQYKKQNYQTKKHGDFGEQKENEEANKILDILKRANTINTDTLTKFVPIILRVKDHWYEDLRYDYTIDESSNQSQKQPCYSYEDNDGAGSMNKYEYTAEKTDAESVAQASEARMLYISEWAPGKIVQKYKPKTENTGEYLDLLLGNEYYIYDGHGRSEKKKKIDLENMSVDVIAMLEQIQGEDAQQIIRMFKLYMARHGIKFEATGATGYKKAICSKIINKEDWDCENNLLVEDESSYVLRADIPPAQYGFPISTEDKPIYVVAPVNGEIVYRSDDNVCIKIDDGGGEHDEWTLLISGFRVNENTQEGQTVSEGTQLGQTVKRDIKMVLRDENGAIIQNTYESYVDVEYDQEKGNVTREKNGRRNNDDIYYVIEQSGVFTDKEKERIGGPNDEFITALVDMQDAYGIDPFWALAVAHWESHCGTDYPEEQHRLFNISSGWSNGEIKSLEKPGAGVASGKNNFATYESDKKAILDFGNFAAHRFDKSLKTVDEFEEFVTDGGSFKLFENAKKKDYPTYLKLKTVYSGKGA